MAVQRQYPYNQFNFQVKFGSTQASFQEVSGLGMEIHVAEYRSGDNSGNATSNAPIKVIGLSKYNDVTFKRGVIGDITTLYTWFNNAAQGRGPTGSGSINASNGGVTVTINLMDDTNTGTPVQTWVLTNARPMKLTGPTFNGKATDVAIEELVLFTEGVTQS
jgi:phage tail-like protein